MTGVLSTTTDNGRGHCVRFQVSGFKFQVSGFKFPVSSFKIQSFRFQVSGFKVQVPGSRFKVSNAYFFKFMTIIVMRNYSAIKHA